MDLQPSPELVRRTIGAMERGLSVIQKQGGLPPMLIHLAGSEVKIEALTAAKDSAEAGRLARVRAAELHAADACVLIYETYIRLEGQRFDAIVAETHDRRDELAFVFARRYSPAQDGRPFAVLDKGIVGLGTTTAILPPSAPVLEWYVQIPSGAVIGNLVTIVDRMDIEYLALHNDQVIRVKATLKSPQKIACLLRVEAADEWTAAHADELACDMTEVRQFLDPEDKGVALCLGVMTRDHLGTPAEVDRLKPLLSALHRVSARIGGAGLLVHSKASKGPGSLEEAAIDFLRGLQP
jgi:hypothetical protein